MVNEFSANLKKDMIKCDSLIGQVEKVSQSLEQFKKPNAAEQVGHDEFAKILAEIHGKVNKQGEQLQILDEQIPFITNATNSVAAIIQRSKCKNCSKLNIINVIKTAENK